jgi:hypothetical protein
MVEVNALLSKLLLLLLLPFVLLLAVISDIFGLEFSEK